MYQQFKFLVSKNSEYCTQLQYSLLPFFFFRKSCDCQEHQVTQVYLLVCLMVFNATFNNISVISWWTVLLVEETGVPTENHQPVTSH